jgi:hypothetical protein
VVGSSASSFWCSAVPPLRRCLRRRCRAAGESPLCCCSSRRRRQGGDGCTKGRQGGFKTAALQVRGAMVVDLWRTSQIGCRLSSGCVHGRCSFIAFGSSSSELVVLAAHQRLRARGSSAPAVVARGGRLLQRLRRWRVRAFGDLEVEDGGSKLRRPLFSPFSCTCPCCVYFSV